jgi:hypothetical protein
MNTPRMNTPRMNTPRSVRTYLSIAALSGAAMLAAGMMALVQPAGVAQADDGYGRGMGYGPPPQAYGFHGHHRYGHGGPCGARAAGMIKHLDGVVPDLMNLDTGQQKAWDDLMASADAARDKVKDACGERPGRDATAPERMAHMEAVLTAGLEGVREVRPRFDAFYAGLSERQREGLDELLRHGGRRFGAMHDRDVDRMDNRTPGDTSDR